MSKQSTLFETWKNGVAERGDVEDSDDIDEFDAIFRTVSDDLPEPLPKVTAKEDIPGFDSSAGKLWIYPTNYPIRDYQFNIVQKCLFKNTLVCLPTGLGKTFIAAVVMFNFYRWYPSGKILFLAPTKPLVAQQIEACHGITGIPQEHLAEMTGSLQPSARLELWNSKRVFFLTPQVLQNDLGRGSCPATCVCCVVFDEAHKALGNHAYCQVIKELSNARSHYRVLALSATPGNDLKAVQQVLSNLQISHIELRSEDSFDIQQYVHSRAIEKIVVPLEGPVLEVKETFLKMLSGVVGRLSKLGLLFSSDPDRLGKYQILQAREKYRHTPPSSITPAQAGAIESDFALSISLFHAYELLLQHGLRSFYHFLSHTLWGVAGGQSRAKLELSRSAGFKLIMNRLEGQLTKCEDMTSCQEGVPFFYSHPKLNKLEEVVLEHFNMATNSETRVMIFSQYRESVQEITDMLVRHAPLVRVMSFVGHANSGKMNRGLTHKEQTMVVQQFRNGGYNALVSTCVGEEGLDIGEVDLIVCFDAHKSPIRLVQRMGRTGRKRSGRIVVIVGEGKEEQIYLKSQSNKSSLHRAITEGCRSLQMYPSSCVMIPRHITPQVCMMHLSVETSKKACVTTGVKRKGSTIALGNSGRGCHLGNSGRDCHLGSSSDGFLSEHELKEWTKWFSLPDQECALIETAVSSVFESTCHTTLQSLNSVPRTGGKNVCKILNLSCWAHWQTAPIPYHIAGHSQRSVQLVSILNFIDHIHSTNGVGLNYEIEMKAFLDMNDVKPLVQEEKGNRKRTRTLDDSSDEDLVKQLKYNTELLADDNTVETCYSNAQLPLNHSTLVNPCVSVDNENKPTLVPQAPILNSLDWLNDFDPSQLVTPVGTPQADSAAKKVAETHFKPLPISLPPALCSDTPSSSCSIFEGLSSTMLFDNEDMTDAMSEGRRGLLRTPDTNVTVVAESDLDDEEGSNSIAVPSPLSPEVERPCHLPSVSHEDSFLLLHGNRQQRPHNPLMTPPILQSTAKRIAVTSPVQLFGAEINDFLEEEAEVSGSDSEGPGSDGMENGQSDDEYEDSFINDNTFLTQYPSTGYCENKGASPMGSRKKNSPTGPCRNRYRMVLSQRHTILGRLMKKDSDCKAAAKKSKLNIHEGDYQKVMYDVQEGIGNDQQAVGDHNSDAETEAEEVFIEYGEEDREEFTCTQQLPAESVIVKEQVLEEGLLSSCTPVVVSSKQCSDHNVSDSDVVDSSLMASIQLVPTPCCLAIGMEDWLRSNNETCVRNCEDNKTKQMGDEKLLHKSKIPFMSLGSVQSKGTILASSRAVANSQVVSILRYKYGLCVNLLSLPHGGFIVSNTMLVERRQQSELNKPSIFTKFISKLLNLSEAYCLVCVVLEQDKIRLGKKAKSGVQYNRMLAQLVSTKVILMFSQSQEHTASLLNIMVAMEIHRGQGILIPADIGHTSSHVLQLLMKVPKLSYMTALNICVCYSTVADIMQCSSQELLEKVPAMNHSSAKAVYQFFNHVYNSSLVC